MPIQIHNKTYITVAERVKEAGADFIGLETEVLQHDPVVIKATITVKSEKYANIIERRFTGISAANPLKAIEKSNPYEVAETSAVGRALGFAGYGLIDSIASADEMVKAEINNPDEQFLNQIDESKETKQEDCPICHNSVWINEGEKNGKPWKYKKCTKDPSHLVWWDFDLDGWRGL